MWLHMHKEHLGRIHLVAHPFLQVGLVCITVCPASILISSSFERYLATLPLSYQPFNLTSPEQRRQTDRERERARGRERDWLPPFISVMLWERSRRERESVWAQTECLQVVHIWNQQWTKILAAFTIAVNLGMETEERATRSCAAFMWAACAHQEENSR